MPVLRVTVHQAMPGMVLAAQIAHPAMPGVALLQRGFTLEQRVIARLHEFGVRDMWVEFPGMDFMGRFVRPRIERAHQHVTRLAAALFDDAMVGLDPELDFHAYKPAVQDLIAKLYEEPSAWVFINELRGDDAVMALSSTNVCMLSVLMGLKLDFHLIRERPKLGPTKAKEVTNLGLGGLLHDIGMLDADRDAVERWRETGDESDPAWREHPMLGYERVRGQIDPAAAGIVLHHHQRFDGSGFPGRATADTQSKALSGSAIHVLARIVGCATIYEELRRGCGPRPGLPAVGALQELVRSAKRAWVDPVVLRGLLAVAPAYAPGSVVRLSTGEMAIVRRWRPENPCCPVVEPLGDDKLDIARAKAQRDSIDLRDRGDLEIIEAEGVDVREMNFYPSIEEEFDLWACARGVMPDATEAEALD